RLCYFFRPEVAFGGVTVLPPLPTTLVGNWNMTSQSITSSVGTVQFTSANQMLTKISGSPELLGSIPYTFDFSARTLTFANGTATNTVTGTQQPITFAATFVISSFSSSSFSVYPIGAPGAVFTYTSIQNFDSPDGAFSVVNLQGKTLPISIFPGKQVLVQL